MALNFELDAHDTRILAELQADARLTMSELGRRVHHAANVVPVPGHVQPDGAAQAQAGQRGAAFKLIQQTPECINAYNVTGEDSWVLEIAVIDVAHLDSVVSKFCLLTETATSIILNPAREHQPMLPPRREDVKPPIRKVTQA